MNNPSPARSDRLHRTPIQAHSLRRLSQIGPAVMAAASYILVGISRYGLSGFLTGRSWHGWSDQGLYMASSQAFASGQLTPAQHWYPLLYPLLATPALRFFPENPFLPLDLACFVIVACCVVRVCGHFDIRRSAALAVFLATSVLYPALQGAWLDPWTSTLSSALIWLLIATAADVILNPSRVPPTYRQAACLGALAALVPLVRPADGVVVAVIGLYLACTLAARRSISGTVVLAALTTAASVAMIYGFIHLAIYGPHLTDYMRQSAALGFAVSALPWKATILFVEPRPWFPQGDGILRVMPWIPIGIVGGIHAATLNGDRTRGGFVACLLIAAGIYAAMLAAYVDLLPPGLWHYGNIHYFKWLFPLLGMFSWILVRDSGSQRAIVFTMLAAFVALTGFRYDAVPAAPAEPARRLDFRVPPSENDWNRIYFAPSAIDDGGNLSRNIVGYRQVLDRTTIRAVDLRGSFGPAAVWYGGGVAGHGLLPGIVNPAPESRLRGAWPQPPIRRWKAKLVWGKPCWLFACPDR